MMEFVSWDDEIPIYYIWKNKSHVPNHQSGGFFQYRSASNMVKLQDFLPEIPEEFQEIPLTKVFHQPWEGKSHG